MKKATLIYNPLAGRRPARRAREIRQMVEVLKKAGIEVKPTPTTGPGTAQKEAHTAVAEGDDLVLVCGGDGTINEVINGLALGKTALGILPGGTANIIAKELRLPHDPVAAARALPHWKPRRITLGQATWHSPGQPSASSPEPQRRFFVGVAGVGFDAYIIHRLSTSFKMSWGVAAYVVEALRQVWRYPFPTFSCLMEKGRREATFLVVHRSGHYAGWLPLAPAASLFRPDFIACLFKSPRRARYLLYAAAAILRQHLRLPDVELVEGHKIVCAPDGNRGPIYFELDGELVGEIPVTFETVPDALTLLVP